MERGPCSGSFEHVAGEPEDPKAGAAGEPCFERQQQPGCGDPLAGGALQLASLAGRREDERPGKSVMPAPASPSPAAGRTEWLFPRAKALGYGASTIPRSRLERSVYPIHEPLEETNQSYPT